MRRLRNNLIFSFRLNRHYETEVVYGATFYNCGLILVGS